MQMGLGPHPGKGLFLGPTIRFPGYSQVRKEPRPFCLWCSKLLTTKGGHTPNRSCDVAVSVSSVGRRGIVPPKLQDPMASRALKALREAGPSSAQDKEGAEEEVEENVWKEL